MVLIRNQSPQKGPCPSYLVAKRFGSGSIVCTPEPRESLEILASERSDLRFLARIYVATGQGVVSLKACLFIDLNLTSGPDELEDEIS